MVSVIESPFWMSIAAASASSIVSIMIGVSIEFSGALINLRQWLGHYALTIVFDKPGTENCIASIQTSF